MSGPFPPSPSVTPHQAEVRALRVAQETAALVPAYARFLRLAGYDASRLRSYADFRALPVMDKASYLTRYPLAERCRRGDVTQAYIVTRSSGTSGPATFWPRTPEQTPPMLAAVRVMLQEHFRIQDRWTLMVLATALGPWGYATSMTQLAQRLFSESDVRGTVVTPGLNEEEALRFVEQLSPQYDQTILVGYPALLPALLEAGQQRGISWASLNAGVVLGGEGASEAQRERILEYLGRDPERLEGLVNTFGATEVAGIIGYETRLCLLLRPLCARQPALAEALFGAPVVPSVNQYNPLSAFLEVEDGEVLLTLRGAVPLIRYNTHDRGGLLTYDQVVSVCHAHGYDLQQELQTRGAGAQSLRRLPFLYVHGRSDAVILHGGNIYVDEVAHVLEMPELRASNSGNFEVATEPQADGRVTVRLTVELQEGQTATDELMALYQRCVLEGLQEVSARFRAAYAASQGRTRLEVGLVPYGTLQGRGPKQQRVVLPHEPRTTAQPPAGADSR
jgi:phenylacetate-CoA ligase